MASQHVLPQQREERRRRGRCSTVEASAFVIEFEDFAFIFLRKRK